MPRVPREVPCDFIDALLFVAFVSWGISYCACTTAPKPVRLQFKRPEAVAPTGKTMRVIPQTIGDE